MLPYHQASTCHDTHLGFETLVERVSRFLAQVMFSLFRIVGQGFRVAGKGWLPILYHAAHVYNLLAIGSGLCNQTRLQCGVANHNACLTTMPASTTCIWSLWGMLSVDIVSG